ncbi:MAG: ABC transporter ATP-binding protein [Rickettsiaceae bacterium]|nr:ABC transporter ATP-binding protein [Rickettsiaceae bacterium]
MTNNINNLQTKEEEISIELENCYVEGVNTYNRAQGIKHFFLGKGKLLLTSIPILNGINFEAKRGEKIALIGSNGSGKSSLLKVIAGIYPIKSGRLRVVGRVGASIEMGFGMEYEMTGRQNIKLMMVYSDMLDLYNKDIENEIIDFSELGEKIDWPVKTYSSGMLSRLTFSVNLLKNPDILLLDEIFATGDAHFVIKAVKAMTRKFLDTPISMLVSHQEDIIKDLCTKAYLMHEGRIIDEGTPDFIIKRYKMVN